MKAAEMIAFANGRINKGLTYGADMASSKVMCFNDATTLIEMAIAKADDEENPPPFEGDPKAFLDRIRKKAMSGAKRAHGWAEGLEIMAIYAAGQILWYANGMKFSLSEMERQLGGA